MNGENTVFIDITADTKNFEKKLNDSVKYARDTGKELDKNLLIKMDLDIAEMQLKLNNARNLMKKAKADGDEALQLKLQVDINNLSRNLTEAKRQMNNYSNTGDTGLSRLQAKFNQVTDEIKKSRDEMLKLGKSTDGIDILIKKADELEKEFKQGKISQEEFVKGIKDLKKETEQVGNNLNGFGFSMVKLNAILEVGKKVLSGISSAYRNWLNVLSGDEQYERLYRIVNNVTGASREQIKVLNDQAKALASLGVVSSGSITQVQSQLATFDLQIETIKKLTPAVLDYVTAEKGATATAEDFKQATNGLAQALNGNFGSLTRVGFVLDENTKKQIANGTEMERAEAIVSVLNSTYGGFNQALAETPLGKIQNLSNRFNDLKDTLFNNLTPAFSRAIEVIGEFFEILEDPEDVINKYKIKVENTETLMATLEQAYIDGKISIEDYQFAIGELNKNIDGYNTKIQETGNNQKTFTRILIDNFKSMVSTIGNFLKSFGLLFSGIVSSFITGLTAIGEGVGQSIGFIQSNFSILVNNAIVIVASVGGSIAKVVDEITGGIASIINLAIEGLNKLPKVNIKGIVRGTGLYQGTDIGEMQSIDNTFSLDKTKKMAEITKELFNKSGEAFGNAFKDGTEIGFNQALEDGRKLEDILNKTKTGLELNDLKPPIIPKPPKSPKDESKALEEIEKQEIERQKRLANYKAKLREKEQKGLKDRLKNVNETYEKGTNIIKKQTDKAKDNIDGFIKKIEDLKDKIGKLNEDLQNLEIDKISNLGDRNNEIIQKQIDLQKKLNDLKNKGVDIGQAESIGLTTLTQIGTGTIGNSSVEDLIKVAEIQKELNNLSKEKLLISQNLTQDQIKEAQRVGSLSPTEKYLEEFAIEKKKIEDQITNNGEKIKALESQKIAEENILKIFDEKQKTLDENYKTKKFEIEQKITDQLLLQNIARIDSLKNVELQAIATANALRNAGVTFTDPTAMGVNTSGISANSNSSTNTNNISTPTVINQTFNQNINNAVDVNKVNKILAETVANSSKGMSSLKV